MERSISPILFIRSVIWSLVGKIIPILIALVSIPLLIQYLGTERFGILSIIILFVGYFGVLDLGIPRAIIHFMSKIASADTEGLKRLIHTSFTLLLLLSVFAGMLLLAITEPLIHHMLKIEAVFLEESRYSLYAVALSLPLIILTGIYRSILEVHHDFGTINRLQIVFGSLNYGLPVVYAMYNASLFGVVMIMIGTRILNGIFLYVYANKHIPQLGISVGIDRAIVKKLFAYAGWISLTNVVGPFAAYADRIIIGSVITMTAVTYFTAPLEITIKAGVLFFSIIMVLFPTLSNTHAEDRERSVRIYFLVSKVIMAAAFILSLNILLLSDVILDLWLGAEFQENSTFILQLLTITLFVNTLAQSPFTYLQSTGHPDVSAKIWSVLMPVYVIVIYYCTMNWGLIGAASARAAGFGIDAALLYYFCGKRLKLDWNFPMVSAAVASSLILIGCLFLKTGITPWLYSIPLQGAYLVMVYVLIFTPAEKDNLKSLYRFRTVSDT